MRPLTPTEAADLARVITHPRFCYLHRDVMGKWRCLFYGVEAPSHVVEDYSREACLRAAVRWCEENP